MIDVIEILDMTLHQLRAFALVAELGSYKDAAEAFEVSRPCMTFLIKGLEKEYQLKLFNRIRNRTVISSSGEVLLQKAKRVLDDANQLEEEVNKLNGLEKGKLSVGGSSLASYLFLPVVVQKYKLKFSGIEIHLEIQDSKQLEKLLLDGHFDLVIMGFRPQSPLLVSEFYIAEKIVAIAPPDHPLTKRESVSLELLAKESLVITSKGNQVRDKVERRFSERGLPFKSALEISSIHGARSAIKSALLGGLGVSFITRCYLLPEFQTGEIKQLKVPGLDVRRELYIVRHKNRQDAKLLQTFVNFLWDYQKEQSTLKKR